MPTSSSASKQPNVHSWCHLSVGWPIEAVVVEVEVQAPRDITIFEWAIVRTLEGFPEDTPTLAEAADQLGIKAPVFLEETLQTLIQLGAVELKAPDQPVDLPNSRLNSQGRRLLRAGRTGGLPERHGLHLHFDAVTGEHILKPRNLCNQPTRPVLSPEQLPAPVTQMGLDRVRKLSQAQGEPFHDGESRIRSATVQQEAGSHAWLPMEVALEIDPHGVLLANLQNASDAQRDWFAHRDLAMLDGLERASTGGWANGRCQTRLPALTAEKWFASVARLIPPSATADEARQMLHAAESEVVLHAGWLDGLLVEETLTNAAERGVRCYVCGAEPSLTHWSVEESRPPGFIVSGGLPNDARPLVIVVDGVRALRVDLICARSPGGRGLDLEVAAFAHDSGAASLRQQLLNGVAESLDDSDDQQAFAVFALCGDLTRWERGAQRIWNQTDGLERVVKLRNWAEWGRQVAGEEASDEWNAWPVRSWRAAFAAAIEGLNGQLDPVLDAGVGLVPPSEVLSQLVKGIEPIPVLEDADALCELLKAAAKVCWRWPTFNPVKSCRPFAQALQSTLNGTDAERHGPAMRAAMQAVGRTPELRAAHDLCARLLSASLPKPHDPAGLVGWLEAHVPLKRLLGSGFQQRARQHLKQFQFEFSASRAPVNSTPRALKRVWSELQLPAADLAGHANPSPGQNSSGKRPRQRNQ